MGLLDVDNATYWATMDVLRVLMKVKVLSMAEYFFILEDWHGLPSSRRSSVSARV